MLLAQERRANNLVFVFKKTIGKFAYIAEVGSQVEKGNKPPSTLYMKLWNRENNAAFGQSVVVTLPYVRKEIPIVIVFRALGIESDREILEHIVYNLKDIQVDARSSAASSITTQTEPVCGLKRRQDNT